MTHLLALACLPTAFVVLCALSIIDLKTYLLPNKLVGGLAVLGVSFHVLTDFAYASPLDMLAGAALGGGILFAIRWAANKATGEDTLGLGDVKLLAAAGLWLGGSAVLMAMTLGALAGLVHGFGVAIYQKFKTGRMADFKTLSIPAGPGFAVGILAAGIYKFAGVF